MLVLNYLEIILLKKRIAVIGSGVSGLTLANELNNFWDVTVFEKSSGVGGRMATRTMQPFEFDHGAQFFTARTGVFKKFLAPFIDQEIVTTWSPKIISLEKGKKSFKRLWFEPHFIAQPKMTNLAKSLSKSLNIHLNTKIDKVCKKNSRWSLLNNDEVVGDRFDWIVFSAPAPQIRKIFNFSSINYEGLEDVSYLPCFSLMLGFKSDITLNFNAALVKNSPINWISMNSSKPGRERFKTLVIHSHNNWAHKNLEMELSQVQDILFTELKSLIGSSCSNFDHIDTHSWRYAKNIVSAGREFFKDDTLKIGLCGDWCRGDRIEDAFLSGKGLAMELMKI